MGAVVGEQAHVAALVLEEHQVLAQQPYVLGGVGLSQLLGKGDRVPVAKQQLDGLRARAHPDEQLVLFVCQHPAFLHTGSANGRYFFPAAP